VKPLRLELEGFSCYHERQVISFDDLELFAIAGPTGAGKSMLLDAITFALYGQTARLGRINLDTLISPGKDRLEVDLQFQVASGVFRVVRTAERRASGSVVRNTRVALLDDGAGWQQLPESERLRDADQKLQEVIGLDYDGFTRSVLLPQGAFDEFLKGDASKRRNLLISLFGLERIEEMRQQAITRHSAAGALIRQLTASLEGEYASVTPQLVRELSDRLAALQEEREQAGKDLTLLEARLERLAEQERLSSELAAVRQGLEALQLQAQKMAELTREEEQGRRALTLTPLLAQHQQRAAAAGKLEQEAQRLGQAAARLEPLAAQAREEAERSRLLLEQEEPAKLERMASLKTVEPLSATLLELGGKLEQAGSFDGQTRYSPGTLSLLRELQAQVPALRRAAAERERTEKQLERSSAQLEEARQQAEAAAAALQDVVARGKAARKVQEEAAHARAEAELLDQAQALRQHVHEGADCPVCGQVIASLPQQADSRLAELKRQLTGAEKAVAALLEEHRERTAAQAATRERLAQAGQVARQAAGQLEAAGAALQEAREPFSAAGRSGTPDQLAAELQQQYAQQLAALASQITGLTGGEDPRRALAGAEAELARLRQESVQAERAAAEAARELSETRLRLDLQREALAGQQAELAELAEALQQGLQAAGFADASELQQHARSEEQLARMRQQLQEHAQELQRLTARRLELESGLQGVEYPAGEHRQLRLERTALQQRHAALNEQTGRTGAELEAARTRLETVRQHHAAREAAQREHDTWTQLDRDLRASAFTTYLLSQVQQRLASRASVIIRQVTEGRYNLHLAGQDEYQVSDSWTADGELRSVRSLSGGETFIVSLALALALSDTIAGGQALGALFLDEGFGTLDAATLESVAQVLEALTREGRMVGIITHVTDLTERMPARLLVSKGPAGSSVRWDD
jgi:exonuclease SbcC